MKKRFSNPLCQITVGVYKTWLLTWNSHFFATQLAESTDITGKPQLVAFQQDWLWCRHYRTIFISQTTPRNNKRPRHSWCCRQLFPFSRIPWKSCISICTDSAPSVSGSLKGFVALPRQKNPGTALTYCFLPREALISKSIVSQVRKVLDETIKMVHYIKTTPLQSRLFYHGDAHTQLLHTEVRWLSRGRVSSWFYELGERLYEIYLTHVLLSRFHDTHRTSRS
jgi:hypothetical protein